MTIKLTRLPDIDSDRQLQATAFWAYGRFAVLLDGSLWYGDLYSSHPSVTRTGWYWAVDREGDLYVSARGAGIDGEILIRERRDILAWVIAELVSRRVIRKPETLRIEEQR